MIPETHQIEEFLRGLPRLVNWPERDIRWLASSVIPVELAKDASVFALAHNSDDAFIVYKGRVRQFIADQTGKEWWFRTCLRGTALMQERLFRGEGHATQAVVEEPSTVVLQVNAWTLNEMLTRHPDMWDLLSASTVFRLQGIPILRALIDSQIEILASTVVAKEYQPGQTICRRDDEEGHLWIVDWGQVRITERGSMGVDAGGRSVVHDQNGSAPAQPSSTPDVVTAGNYFAGGKLAIWNVPGLETVTAQAQTRTRLLSIEGKVVERMASTVNDVRDQLTQRVDIGEVLKARLKSDNLFSDLKAEHWDDLIAITGWEHVPAGLDVVRQGQYGVKVYALAAGTSHVHTRDGSGRDLPEYLLPKEGGGNYFGINALLSGDRYPATVRSTVSPLAGGAVLDGSDWLTIQREDLEYVVRTNLERWKTTALGGLVLKGPTGKEYPWLKQDEDVILVSHRHSIWLWLRIILAFLISYSIVGLLALVARLFSHPFSTLTYALVLLTPLVLLLTWYLIDYYNDYYVVTTHRLVRRDQVLLISENRVDAMMERVQDTVLNTRLIGKIFNFGDLNISTAATGGVVRFNMLPEPAKVQEIIAGLQSKRRAFLQAEERENLRHMMLQKLNIRIIPTFPARALPEGTAAPTVDHPMGGFFKRLFSPVRRFFRWLWRFPETAYIWLVSLASKRAGEEIKKERAAKKRSLGEQDPDTRVYRKHPWFLFRAAAIPIITLAISIIILLIPGRPLIEAGIPPLIMGGLWTWVFICMFWLWFRVENWRNDKYILTRLHIIDIYALPLGLREEVKQAEWSKVQNASFVIPYFWANLLDFGTVTVETASTFGNFEFLHVPHPAVVQQEVFLRMEVARQASEAKARAAQQSVQLEALELYHHYQGNRETEEAGHQPRNPDTHG